MATYTLPSLRMTSLIGDGTITVPANQTWIVKTINYEFEQSVTGNKQFGRAVATINSNSLVLVDIVIDYGGGESIVGDGGSCNGSSLVMKTGDTIVTTKTAGAATFNLYVYYYIFEQDF